MGEKRILLIDVDSQRKKKNGQEEVFPNLALMKISAYHKAQGHYVDLVKGLPDSLPIPDYGQAYISCIYYQNAQEAHDYHTALEEIGIYSQIGGSGISEEWLPDEIEHLMPDYSLYDIDFSIGFTSRGCIRKCPWCIVIEKEGKIRDNAPITEFLHPNHRKVVLLDNNFFASPNWLKNLEYIIDNRLKVNFNQGLDIRTINNHMAQLLSQTKTYNWTFKARGIHVAFDNMAVEKQFLVGMKTLTDNGIPPHHIMVYVLVGFDTSFEQDIHRIDTIIELGAKPYVMPYNKAHLNNDRLRHLARWVNRKYYEFIDRAEYNNGVLAGAG